jgi:hypothetical protein
LAPPGASGGKRARDGERCGEEKGGEDNDKDNNNNNNTKSDAPEEEDKKRNRAEREGHAREEGEVKYLVHYVSLRVSDLGISHEGTCRLTQ